MPQCLRARSLLPTARQINILLIIAFLVSGGDVPALHGDGERNRVTCLPGRAGDVAVRQLPAGQRPSIHTKSSAAVALAAALANLICARR